MRVSHGHYTIDSTDSGVDIFDAGAWILTVTAEDLIAEGTVPPDDEHGWAAYGQRLVYNRE